MTLDHAAVQVQGVDHVEVFVPGRHEAAAWYRRVLGLEPVSEYEHWAETDGGPLMVAPPGGGTMLAMFRGQAGGADVGFRRVAFRVDAENFRLLAGSAVSLGLRTATGDPLSARNVVDHGEALSLYFADPWGNRLEVTTYDLAARTLLRR